jgi:EpsI family protein
VIPFSFAMNPVRGRAISVPLILAGTVLAAGLAALYAPLWSHCWDGWREKDGAYSHGVLIPVLATFMIWQRRDRYAGVALRPALTGLAPVLLGLLLQLLARWAHSTLLSWTSFVILALGGIAALGGWRLCLRLAPPVFFLTFMVPMSKMVTQPIIFGAQMASTALATLFLRGAGFEVQQLGTILQLEQYTLQVALPCSGFKTMIALSAFAACYIYVLRGSLAKKLVLFAAALAFSLIANGLRIALVGVTGELIDATSAQWVHDNGGLPVTALALGGVFLLARLLKCEMTVRDVRCTVRAEEGDSSHAERRADALSAHRERSEPRTAHASMASLVALIAAAALTASRMPTVQAESKAAPVAAREVALTLGQWQGEELDVPADVQKALPSAHILMRRYRSPLGEADVTILTGSDATALHDPHDCIIGDGWEFITDTPRTVELGGNRGVIPVRDVVMTRENRRARMWYWYALDDQVFTSTLPARVALFRSRLIEGRKRGAEYVRLIVGGETTSARTEMMLTDLVRQIVP